MNSMSNFERNMVAADSMVAPAPPSRFAELLPPEPVFTAPADPRQIFSRLLYLLWCWRVRFLIAFSVVSLIGTVCLFVLPINYTAAALVMVGAREPNPLVVSPNAPRGPHDLKLEVDGEIQVIKSPSLLRRVVQQLNLGERPEFADRANPKPNSIIRLRALLFGQTEDRLTRNDPTDIIVSKLAERLKVEPIKDSAVVRISFTAGDPGFAAEVVNSIVHNAANDDDLLAGLTLMERVGFDLPKAWAVSAAIVPHQPSSPNFGLIILVTIVLGVGGGMAVIFLSDFYASKKVLNAEQIRRQGVRSLALIPELAATGSYRLPTTISKQPQLFGDSIAALHASLLPLTPRTQPGCLVLLFTSALPFEGKSTTVAALAASIAKGGSRVLVIDADLRAPTLHQILGIDDKPGLAECLDTDWEFDSVIKCDPASGIFLLPAGRCHSRPVDVLGSSRLHATIKAWRNSFDFILIDAPPILPVPDARLLIPVIDYCVFVARWGKTSWECVNQGLLAAMDAGARIAGLTVSRVNVKELEAYGVVEPMLYGHSYRRSDEKLLGESKA